MNLTTVDLNLTGARLDLTVERLNLTTVDLNLTGVRLNLTVERLNLTTVHLEPRYLVTANGGGDSAGLAICSSGGNVDSAVAPLGLRKS